jgi:tRNA(fMet)-specific endonuclease VapC
MVTHLLDTNTISYAFRGEGGVGLRMLATAPSRIGIPTPVLYEALAGIWRMPAGARRLALEGALSQLLQTTTVIAFDERCAREASRLRVVLEAKGALIGNLDIQIAGLALANDMTLVTRNVNEFHRVDGLRTENWYVTSS